VNEDRTPTPPLGRCGTLVWLNRLRRLTLRSERRADIHPAFLSLGGSRIGSRQALNR
jgi:hypothetical protein